MHFLSYSFAKNIQFEIQKNCLKTLFLFDLEVKICMLKPKQIFSSYLYNNVWTLSIKGMAKTPNRDL